MLETTTINGTGLGLPTREEIARAHVQHPAIPVVLATAYRSGLDAEVARRPFLRLVQKPIGYEALHRVIHECAGDPSAGA